MRTLSGGHRPEWIQGKYLTKPPELLGLFAVTPSEIRTFPTFLAAPLWR